MDNWIHMCKIIKLDTQLTLYININSKWCILILMLKGEYIKLLGKEIGVNLCDLGLGNVFLYVIPQSTNDFGKNR